jgi:cytochrome P450
MNVLMRNSTGVRLLLPPVARYLPTPAMISFRHAIRQLDEMVYSIIAMRRTDERDTGDLLSMLMQARDEDGGCMSDKQLRDEVMTFLLAGHETTALTLSWTWYLLAENPEVETKLHRELREVLGGRAPEFPDLPKLQYAERVLKESVRLYPPAWSLARTVIKEFEIGGYRIPAGSNVVMSQWIMHRDARYFPDPTKFDPDRWLPEKSQKLPRFAYFPFGGGPRQCIGASFAMMEATILLSTIAQRFSMTTMPGQDVTPVPSFTLRPKHGIQMKLQARHPESAANALTVASIRMASL